MSCGSGNLLENSLFTEISENISVGRKQLISAAFFACELKMQVAQ